MLAQSLELKYYAYNDQNNCSLIVNNYEYFVVFFKGFRNLFLDH